jgi:hypothetical protein
MRSPVRKKIFLRESPGSVRDPITPVATRSWRCTETVDFARPARETISSNVYSRSRSAARIERRTGFSTARVPIGVEYRSISRSGFGRPGLPLPSILCSIEEDRKDDISNVRIH